MSITHGRLTVVTIDGDDISPFTNKTDFGDEVDVEDVTCYGATRKAYGAGLGDGKITISGVHDDGATGPRAVLKALMAARVPATFIFRPEGTGAGRPQSSVSVLVKAYNESAAVAEHVKWTAELQMTGALNEADQT